MAKTRSTMLGLADLFAEDEVEGGEQEEGVQNTKTKTSLVCKTFQLRRFHLNALILHFGSQKNLPRHGKHADLLVLKISKC